MTQKTNPWTFDVRVRERNLKNGSVTEKDVDKYIAGLPDLADQSEAFGTSQPALAQPVVVVEEEPIGADEGDDEDDEDDDDGDDVVGEAAAPEGESSSDGGGSDDAGGGGGGNSDDGSVG